MDSNTNDTKQDGAAKVIFALRKTTARHQQEAALGAFRVIATQVEPDSLGNACVSVCFLDKLQQIPAQRYDLLPSAARVLATLLLASAEACDATSAGKREA